MTWKRLIHCKTKQSTNCYIHFQINTVEKVLNPLISYPSISTLQQGWLWQQITHIYHQTKKPNSTSFHYHPLFIYELLHAQKNKHPILKGGHIDLHPPPLKSDFFVVLFCFVNSSLGIQSSCTLLKNLPCIACCSWQKDWISTDFSLSPVGTSNVSLWWLHLY